MAEFGKTEAHNGGILAVVKKSAKFGLGGGCDNKFANAGCDMEGSIELEWNAIVGMTAHEEDAAKSAPSHWFRKIRRFRVYVENHIRGNVPDGGVAVC